MTFRILVVCSANVCRSPLAAALLRQGLVVTALADEVEVTSCGEHAWRGLDLCDAILAEGLLDTVEVERRAEHRPEQLTAGLLRRAGLVLPMDRYLRSSVVRLEPHVHDRCFTLREAAALARHVADEPGSGVYDNPTEWLEHLVSELNDARGLIPMPGVTSYPRTFLPWPRFAVHGHDVPDPHDDPRVPHRVTRELLKRACAELSESLRTAATRYESRTNAPWWKR